MRGPRLRDRRRQRQREARSSRRAVRRSSASTSPALLSAAQAPPAVQRRADGLGDDRRRRVAGASGGRASSASVVCVHRPRAEREQQQFLTQAVDLFVGRAGDDVLVRIELRVQRTVEAERVHRFDRRPLPIARPAGRAARRGCAHRETVAGAPGLDRAARASSSVCGSAVKPSRAP